MSDKKRKPTTEEILEKLKNSPLQNLVCHIKEEKYLLSLPMLKTLAWNAIPDLIKDETSEQAKQNQLLRTGIKALIRPLLPKILKETWGEEVEITPRLNILTWLSAYSVHLIVNLIASREWLIHVETCEACGERIYKVVGISPKPISATTAEISAPPTTTPAHS